MSKVVYFIYLIITIILLGFILVGIVNQNNNSSMKEQCMQELRSYEFRYNFGNVSSWTAEEKNSFVFTYSALLNKCNDYLD